jgi:hypothetical protein
MPPLPQYDSRAADRGLTPNNVGMEARAQEGSRIGAFGQQERNDVDQLARTAATVDQTWEEHQTFQQISAGMAADATNYNASLQAYAQTLKDPSVDKGDPTLAKTAVDQFKASQAKIAESFTTQKGKDWYLEHSAQQLDRFQQTVIGQTSQYAGLQALQNNEQATRANAATATQDPTQVSGLLDATERGHRGMAATATIDASTGERISEMTNEDGAKIADAGAQGAIYKVATRLGNQGITDPEAIKTQVQAAFTAYMGSDNRLAGLIGEKQPEYDRLIESASKAAASDGARQLEMAKVQGEVKSQQKANVFLAAFGTTDLSNPDNLKQATTAVLVDHDLLPAAKDSLIAMSERLSKQGADGVNAPGKDSPATVNGLIMRINAGDKTVTPAMITDLVGRANGLSIDGAKFLTEQLDPKGSHELDGKQLETEMALWKAKLASTGLQPGMKDAAGDERYSDALNYYAPIISNNDKNGISRSDTFGPPDAQHPHSMYAQRPIESFMPAHVAAGQPHQTPPGGSNLLDTVNHMWGDVVAATSGGAEVRTPIDRTPAPAIGSPAPGPIAGAGTPERQAQIRAILAKALAGN